LKDFEKKLEAAEQRKKELKHQFDRETSIQQSLYDYMLAIQSAAEDPAAVASSKKYPTLDELILQTGEAQQRMKAKHMNWLRERKSAGDAIDSWEWKFPQCLQRYKDEGYTYYPEDEEDAYEEQEKGEKKSGYDTYTPAPPQPPAPAPAPASAPAPPRLDAGRGQPKTRGGFRGGAR
jgi:hypothetical protein